MKKIVCPLCSHQDFINNQDLDSDFHLGFKLISPKGKEGRQMYWCIIWHSSGHATIYSIDKMNRRWVNGDSMIVIYCK
jgi:uncharacterized membrane protein YhaH (DUF805 family)